MHSPHYTMNVHMNVYPYLFSAPFPTFTTKDPSPTFHQGNEAKERIMLEQFYVLEPFQIWLYTISQVLELVQNSECNSFTTSIGKLSKYLLFSFHKNTSSRINISMMNWYGWFKESVATESSCNIYKANAANFQLRNEVRRKSILL